MNGYDVINHVVITENTVLEKARCKKQSLYRVKNYHTLGVLNITSKQSKKFYENVTRGVRRMKI